MKVPFTIETHLASKTSRNCVVPVGDSIPYSAYEPKSVLELRGSPKSTFTELLVPELGDNRQHDLINPNSHFEDWDSWMMELGLHDEEDDDFPVSGTPVIQQNLGPDFPPLFPDTEFSNLTDFPAYAAAPVVSPWNVGMEYVDELIRFVDCFESNSFQMGQVMLARLNERLSSPVGKPIQRAAFYFKEALQFLLSSAAPIRRGAAEIVQTIKAHKMFPALSPIPLFSSFTANQAVLEAIDGARDVHAVDFEIGFGGQWASFMKEIAESHKSAAAPPSVRISAVVSEEHEVESNLVRDNLTQFARELNIRFEIDFIPIRNFQHLSFKAIKFIDGEKVAVVLSPSIFRQIGTGFLNDLPHISPSVVVHVDMEGQFGHTTSFRQAVITGVEFYAGLMESIEAANMLGANGWDWIQKIETFILYPKIIQGIEGICRNGTTAREALTAAGLKPIGISQFAEFQAECLLRKFEVTGFQVVRRQGEMAIYWQGRVLGAMSAWRY